jgi:PIN domain nuclease of toxin-antitoxin system
LKLLLDSQVLLWTIYAPHLLPERLTLLIRNPATELIVSHASLWELLGKIGRGKLLLAGTSVDTAMERIGALGVTFLPVEIDDIVAAAKLPQHHNDPFDRIIIAQAIRGKLPVASSDAMFPNYDIEVVWK